MEQKGISQQQLIQQILNIGHGDYMIYKEVGLVAARQEPLLFAHLIAWNNLKGEVRDSKAALPIIALRGPFDAELAENAVAHLVSLDPRNLHKAILFHKKLIKENCRTTSGHGNLLEKAVIRYIKIREENPGWWNRTVLQHRSSMKALYATYHVNPSAIAQAVLFDNQKPKGSIFEAVANLRHMNPQEAAGTILHFKIPFLIAVGAVGGIKNSSDIVLALIENSSGNEIINNAKMFQKLGVLENPALKAAYNAALERAKLTNKTTTMKAQKAASVMKDTAVAEKFHKIQEEKLDQLGQIEGTWLILADRSGSMDHSIEKGREIASLIAKQAEKTFLVFFNRVPLVFEVAKTATLENIKAATRNVTASGGTSIGCGLEMMRQNNVTINGIVICSDGGDNSTPLFHHAYVRYCQQMGIEPNIYFFWLYGESDVLSRYCQKGGIEIQKFDANHLDYYSLPNVIKTLKTQKYKLLDEIMSTPLLTFNKVFGGQK